jgi:hypothetical protein
MNWPYAVAALAAIIVLGIVADRYERRAARRARQADAAAKHRRLIDEINRQP